MSSWLTRSLLVVLAFVLCWLGAIAYWRDTNRMPGADDLLIWLLLLPLLLVLAVWAGIKLFKKFKGGAAAAAPAAAAPAAAAADTPPPAPPLTVLAGALRMPHGDHPAQLGAVLLARKANLALDPELTNDSGYPILSGRVDDVDAAGQQDALADWLQAHHPQADFTDEQWRALALGGAVAGELALELGAHPQLPAYLDAASARQATPPLPVLQLVAVLPSDWREPERAAAADWLRQLAAQGWPGARLSMPFAPPGTPPLQLVQQLAAQARLDEEPFVCLLLACDSRIGAASVDDWARQSMLFDSNTPHGRIPGEGAAGLLLLDAAQAALFGRDDLVDLHPAHSARRAASMDDKPRAEAGLLAALAAQAFGTAGVDPASVTVLAADTDQRPGRMGETMGMATTALPELDPSSQVLAVGSACGDAGAVTTVAALVLAQQQASTNAAPALCISNLDPFHRSAVLLVPHAAAPGTASSST